MVASLSLRNQKATFLNYKLDCNSGSLEMDGKAQKLEPLVFQFLLLLIEKQGQIVSKTSVIETLWPDKKPSDEALRAVVKKSREALNDNARKPTFIKTIPTKGYLFIPPVSLASTIIKSWFSIHLKQLLITCTILIICIFLIVWGFASNTTKITKPKPTLVKTVIASFINGEVSTYKINNALNMVYLQYSFGESESQLVVENIATKIQTRLVFKGRLSKVFWWSENSQRMLVMRNNSMGFYIIQFYPNDKSPTVTEYGTILPKRYQILAFDHNGQQAFVQSLVDQSVQLWNIESGVLTKLPMTVDIESQIIKFVEQNAQQLNADKDTNNSHLMYEIRLWPSPTSTDFIVSLSNNSSTWFFHYLSQGSETAVKYFNLLNKVTEGVWDSAGKRFSFTDTNMVLYSFQLEGERLTTWNTRNESITKLVADCGANCFVVSATVGLPKLVEYGNPFNDGKNSKNHVQHSTINTLVRVESLPLYSNNGQYFVVEERNKTRIVFANTAGKESIIYTFNNKSKVSEYTISQNENYVAGIVNQRPFLLNVTSKELSYLPLKYPKVSNLRFTENEVIEFYAQPIVLTNTKKSLEAKLSEDTTLQTYGLYEYKLPNKELNLVKRNIKTRHILSLTESQQDVEITHQATFEIDRNNNAYVLLNNNKKINLGKLQDTCETCWIIDNNWFYQLQMLQGPEAWPKLQRTNLINGEVETVGIALNTVLKEFVLSPDKSVFTFTTRQNLRTELAKIEGLKQVF